MKKRGIGGGWRVEGKREREGGGEVVLREAVDEGTVPKED